MLANGHIRDKFCALYQGCIIPDCMPTPTGNRFFFKTSCPGTKFDLSQTIGQCFQWILSS